MPLLSASNLRVTFGTHTIFSGITFQVDAADRWGIVGRNGAGKTTLMQLLLGQRAPDEGEVARSNGLRIGVMDQYREFAGADTVWQAAALGFADLFALERDLAEQTDAMAAAGEGVSQAMLDRYARDLDRFEHAGGYTATARVDAVLDGLQFDPAASRQRTVASLSGGERGRLALAAQLASPVDLLILDEPTNHLDLDTSRWLERYLRESGEAVLLISHDRAFLDAVVDHVLHFEAGTAIPYEGNYQRFVMQRAERRMALERAVKKQDAKLAAEEDYIRRNIAGQNSRQAKGRRRRLSRVARLSPPPGEQGAMAVSFTSPARGGDQVLVADHLRVEIEGRVLLRDWSGVLRRNDVVGLIGPNGAGKSTLLRTLIGERQPDGGSVRVMPSIDVSYYRQDLGDVDPAATLYQLIARRRPAWNRGQIQSHLGRFDFSGDAVQRKAQSLSGGERARMALALMMLDEANLLVFDEPTNHLDVESIEALEDAVEDYDGTVVLITHDRALLRALVTRVWSLHDGVLQDFPGTFEEWESRPVATSAPPVEPKRQSAPPQPASARSATSRRRSAERAVADAEAAIARAESRIADLNAALESTALYVTADGRAESARLLAARESADAELAAAYQRWNAATEALES